MLSTHSRLGQGAKRTLESSARGSPGKILQGEARFVQGQILAETPPKIMAKTFGLPANLPGLSQWPRGTDTPDTIGA